MRASRQVKRESEPTLIASQLPAGLEDSVAALTNDLQGESVDQSDDGPYIAHPIAGVDVPLISVLPASSGIIIDIIISCLSIISLERNLISCRYCKVVKCSDNLLLINFK